MEEVRARKRGVDGRAPFEPLVIMEFAADTKQAAIEWMLAKLQASREEGGADLSVRTMMMQHNEEKHDVETILYIGASMARLLSGAEDMQMKKRTKDAFLQEFSLVDLNNFEGAEDLSSFLTKAEKHKIVLHELENTRAQDMDAHIPGYDKISLYPGKSIIKKYLSRGLVLRMFPLHDEEEIKRLGDEWYQPKKVFSPQPIWKIQQYFGEKIAIYFAFLGVYTVSLIPPAVIGILYFITSWHSVYREAFFAIFNLIWSTVFLEAWKRYCAGLVYTWGTMGSITSKFEEPRANFRGSLGRNPVTGKPEPIFPRWKRSVRFYLVSLPVISVCLAAAFMVMLGYFWMQAWVDGLYASEKKWLNFLLLYLPTAIYAVVIGILNAIYRAIAKKLNDWENHRLQSSYDNHFILKLVLFDFINCFISLFYVAFYLQDRQLLKKHLACLLITMQVVGQLREAMVPFLFKRRRTAQLERTLLKSQALQSADSADDLDPAIQRQACCESLMDTYEGTMDDYLELFLQFGYVSLFSSAFPLAAFWALLNNITEIRTDAFKMCRVFQRPFPESAANMGAWQLAFEVISIISVMTNCALIGMDPEVQKLLPSKFSAVNIVIIFVAVEHAVLAVKGMIGYLVNDVPKWVEVKLAQMEYQRNQTIRKQKLPTSSRKQLPTSTAL